MGVARELSAEATTLLDRAADLHAEVADQIETAEWQRKRAIAAALDAGVPISVVSSRLGITRPTLYRWRQDVAEAHDVL